MSAAGESQTSESKLAPRLMETFLEAYGLLAMTRPFSIPNGNTAVENELRSYDCYAYSLESLTINLFLSDAVSYFSYRHQHVRDRRVGFVFQISNQKTISVILEFTGVNKSLLKKLLCRMQSVGILPNDLKELYHHCRMWVIGPEDPSVIQSCLSSIGKVYSQPISINRINTNDELEWMVQTLSYLQTGEASTSAIGHELARYQHHCQHVFLNRLSAIQDKIYYPELINYIIHAYKLFKLHIETQRNYSVQLNSLGAIERVKKMHQGLLNHLYTLKIDINELVREMPFVILSNLLLRVKQSECLLEKLKVDCTQQVCLIQTWEQALAEREQEYRQAWGPWLLLQSKNILQFLIQCTYVSLGLLLATWISNLLSCMRPRVKNPLFMVLGVTVGIAMTIYSQRMAVAKLFLFTLISERWTALHRVSSRHFQSLPHLHPLSISAGQVVRIAVILIAGIEAAYTQRYSPLLLMLAGMSFSAIAICKVQQVVPGLLDQNDIMILSLATYQVGYAFGGYALNYGLFIWAQWSLCQSVLAKMQEKAVDMRYYSAYCTGLSRWRFWLGSSNPLYYEYAQDYFESSHCDIRVDRSVVPTRTIIECEPAAHSNVPILTLH